MTKKNYSSVSRNFWLKGALLVGLGLTAATLPAQDGRHAVSKITPEYPDLARRMRLAGTVKVEVTILASGVVKSATVVGGHPVLAQSAVEAAKRWKFSPSGGETTQILEFEFHP
ncbi:MAG: energy transducer TonB [Acidobacteriia bacterium]|nr:energy transducer TonB [Terriglobia bacterium]